MAKSISGVVVAWSLLATLLASSMASATIVHHSLYIKNLTVNYLCEEQVVIAANGSLPGPTIRVHEGDTLVIKVVNLSPHNISIHWYIYITIIN
uniref:Plastocyanin-like domain-containing protein n=1 Tax=Cannabis sativa TaxID=3483 RepID=A0A803R905_CANSA